MIDRFGDEAQRSKFVPSLCTMERFGSYCLTEPSAGSDAAALRMRAVKRWRRLCAERRQAIHLRRRRFRRLHHHGAHGRRRGPHGVSAFHCSKWERPDCHSAAIEKKMGWNAQPTRQVICEDCTGSGGKSPRRRRAGGSRSRWRGSTAAASISPPARWAAPRPRSTRPWPT